MQKYFAPKTVGLVTVFLLAKELPDFFSPLLWRVLILRKVLLIFHRNHVEY